MDRNKRLTMIGLVILAIVFKASDASAPKGVVASTFAGLFLVALLATKYVASDDYVCGRFMTVRVGETGTLTSRNYPANYQNRDHCIWLLQAPANYTVNVILTNLSMATDAEECTDVLQLREGSWSSTELYSGCNLTSPLNVTTSQRWLWVRYYADDSATSTGFSLDYSLKYTGDPSGVNPISSCFGVHFQCRNKECIPYSYVCDNMNDCGCVGSGCDEDACGGLGWTAGQILWCGIGTGVGVFLVIFFGIGVLEFWLKKRQEAAHKKQLEDEKLRSRRRRPVAKTPVPPEKPKDNSDDVVKIDLSKVNDNIKTTLTLDPNKLEVPKSPFAV